jgi:phosphoserine phosphatase
MVREYGLSPNEWLFVGDGANDVPIARTAPISVGYRPHPELRKVVTHVIHDFNELLGILNFGKVT